MFGDTCSESRLGRRNSNTLYGFPQSFQPSSRVVKKDLFFTHRFSSNHSTPCYFQLQTAQKATSKPFHPCLTNCRLLLGVPKSCVLFVPHFRATCFAHNILLPITQFSPASYYLFSLSASCFVSLLSCQTLASCPLLSLAERKFHAYRQTKIYSWA
jgi:hypothetical protein